MAERFGGNKDGPYRGAVRRSPNDDHSVTYAFKAKRGARGAVALYASTNISKSHFTWRGEKSVDARTWAEFMVVECSRNMK